jgi:glycosyltransferase involved in cell wall biosynthesis
VSAIVPVYDGERYLAEALDSVLAQRCPPTELVVIDDGSTDGSAAVVTRYPRARYHRRDHRGIAASRNRGVALTRAPFIAFLDADDVWTVDKLGAQLAAFAADPGLDIVAGHVEQFHSPDLEPALARAIHCPSGALPGYAFGAMLIKRSAFDRVGQVATDREKAECVDWCLRATDLGLRIRVLPEVVLRRRLHRTNHGLVHRGAIGDYARALKDSLDRRRTAAR